MASVGRVSKGGMVVVAIVVVAGVGGVILFLLGVSVFLAMLFVCVKGLG